MKTIKLLLTFLLLGVIGGQIKAQNNKRTEVSLAMPNDSVTFFTKYFLKPHLRKSEGIPTSEGIEKHLKELRDDELYKKRKAENDSLAKIYNPEAYKNKQLVESQARNKIEFAKAKLTEKHIDLINQQRKFLSDFCAVESTGKISYNLTKEQAKDSGICGEAYDSVTAFIDQLNTLKHIESYTKRGYPFIMYQFFFDDNADELKNDVIIYYTK